MTRSEFLNDLRHEFRTIRNEVQKRFYFLETDELRQKPADGRWSIIENIVHINLVQAHYTDHIAAGLEEAPEVNHDEVHFTWLGRQLIQALAPQDGERRFKIRTLRKVNPRYRAKKGIAIDEKVAFQDFIADIEQLEELMIKAYDRDIEKVKIPTLVPLIKVNMADAFAMVLAHTQRHLLQASELIEED